ncbi:MAG: hypothetical protein Tsb0019_23180 [Roseibium sp.]
MALSGKQAAVLRGMLAALAVSFAALAAGAVLWPENRLPGDAGERLAFAARASLAPAAWLLVSIGTLARHRFFTAEDIDGSGLTAGTSKAKRLQAVLQNTLEQAVLAALAYGCFAALAPQPLLGTLPVAAVLFFVGRALFFHGYGKGAGARALGFALTFYPTVLLFLGCLLVAVVRPS